MKWRTDRIEIILTEVDDEIVDLWNIVEFAFDWEDYAKQNGKSQMNERELKLANELVDLSEKLK